ncbi:hypothetical protein I4U23_011675 [Adineta vaga]|nr:hypothetical protein I4U23_011675 [Adineta vaga]
MPSNSLILIFGFGDSVSASGTVGGYSKSYTMVAANLLRWSARNCARDGARTTAIPCQLSAAASILPNATDIVFTIAVAQKATELKPRLISTYKLIQSSALSTTKT